MYRRGPVRPGGEHRAGYAQPYPPAGRQGDALRARPAASVSHVPLTIFDELQPGTEVSIAVAAEGSGTLILDLGILEVNTS